MADQNQVSVVFSRDVAPNEHASKAAGRPIFEDREVATIYFPGDRQRKLVVLAHEADPNATREAVAAGEIQAGEIITYAQTYRKQYEAFKNQTEQVQSGTPLSELPFLTEARRRELKAVNVHTAEQLASLDGGPLKNLGMFGRENKMAAQAYLERANDSSLVTQQAAQIAALQQQLQDYQANLDTYMNKGVKTKFQRQIEKTVAERQASSDVLASPDGKFYDLETGQETDADGNVLEQQAPAAPEPFDEDFEGGNADAGTEATETESDENAIQDLSNEELKAYIKQQTGEAVRGNPSHETLVQRAIAAYRASSDEPDEA